MTAHIKFKMLLLTFALALNHSTFALKNPFFKNIPQLTNPEVYLKQIKYLAKTDDYLIHTKHFMKIYARNGLKLLPQHINELRTINKLLLSKSTEYRGYVIYSNALCFFSEGNYQKALTILSEELNRLGKKGNPELKFYLEALKASCFYFLGDFDQSTKFYLKALKTYKVEDDRKFTIYQNLGSNFYALRLSEKALEYYLKADEHYKHKKNDILMFITWIYTDFQDFKKADKYAGYLIANQSMMTDFELTALYETLAKIEHFKQNNTRAIELIDQSIDILKNNAVTTNDLIDTDYILISKLAIKGEILMKLKQYNAALDVFNEGLVIAKKTNRKISEIEIYQNLYNASKLIGQNDKALFYIERFNKLEDDLHKDELKNEIVKLERVYNFEKKNKDIKILKNDKKIKQIEIQKSKQYILLLTITILLISIGLFTLFKFNRDNKKKNALKMDLLVKNTELQLVKSQLMGQEIEKSRISQELHDGVANNLLSLIYTSENSLKEPLKAIYNEIRIISHNLSTVAIRNNSSLKEIVLELFYRIFDEREVTLELIWDKKHETFMCEEEVNLVLYRVFQELFINIVKHAEATSVIIEFQKDAHEFTIVIADDGKGPDKKTQGIGLSNIEDRIKTITGRFSIFFNTQYRQKTMGAVSSIVIPI
jgi:signal transduction histidine kinase